MTEKELIKLVIDFAHEQQPAVYVLHFPDSRRIQGDPGLPDLVLRGEYRLIWRELKCDGTELRRDQGAWRWRLTSAGQDYAEWVPGDWRSGQIQAEITALNLPPGQEATAVVSSDPDPERAFFRALYGGKARPSIARRRPGAESSVPGREGCHTRAHGRGNFGLIRPQTEKAPNSVLGHLGAPGVPFP